MVKAKLYRQNHTKKHTHTHSQKEKKEKYIYIFWEVRGLLPAFSRCSVGVVSHVDVFLTYLWGGRWSPCLTPQPSWRSLLFILFFKGKTVLIPRIPWSKDTCFLPWRKCFYSYFIYLFIYFLAVLGLRFVRGLSPVTASGGHSSSRCGDRSSSRCAGPSPPRPPPRCGAQAPDAQAQQPWLTGPAAPRHVGSSQTRARTRVPCISRQTLNHCATREARKCF